MVSLGVGRGGSPSGAFIEGQQAAQQAQLTRQQMRIAEAEEARRAQEFDWKGQDRARSRAGLSEFMAGFPSGGGTIGTELLDGIGQPTALERGTVANTFSDRADASPMMGLRPPGAPALGFSVAPRQRDNAITQQLGPVWAEFELRAGLPQGYFRRLAEVESSLNPNAKNANSTAAGLFQFLRETAQEYGVANPMNPIEATQGAFRYTINAVNRLRQVLGRDPTPGEIYLAHQQGAGGASNLLRNPDRLAAEVVGREAVRLNGGNPDTMTAGQFANMWIRKFEGGSGGATAQAPDRMFMQPDSMQIRAGLAAPYASMLGTPQPTAPTAREPLSSAAADNPEIRRRFGLQIAQFFDRLRSGGGIDPTDPDFLAFQEREPGFAAEALERSAAAQERLQTRQAEIDRLRGTGATPTAAGTQPPTAGQPAGLQVQTPTADTVRPRERPVPTIEELDAQLSGEPTDTTPRTSPFAQGTFSLGDGAEVTFPSAGVQTGGGVLTANIRSGQPLRPSSTATRDLAAYQALFRDAPALAAELRELNAEIDLQQRLLRLAYTQNNAEAMALAAASLSVAQATRDNMNFTAAGLIAETGNFDPMAQALSQMAGTTVTLSPINNNEVRLTVGGEDRGRVPVSQMLDLYRRGVDEQYQERVAAAEAQAAEAQRFIMQETLKSELKINETMWNRIAERDRDIAINAAEAEIARRYPGQEAQFQTIKADDGTEFAVMVNKRNPTQVYGQFVIVPSPTGGPDSVRFIPVQGTQ